MTLKDETGKRYGKWKVLERTANGTRRQVRWLCQCDCGNVGAVQGESLRCGDSTQCCECRNSANTIDETGRRYGKWKVLRRAKKNASNGGARWTCRCDCGNVKTVQGGHLRSGATTQCSECWVQDRTIDETGNQYGTLTVIRQVDVEQAGGACWLCQCDCGNTAVIRGSSLRRSDTISCGCQNPFNPLPSEGMAAMHRVLNRYQRGAERRGLSWKLTEEQFTSLASKPCYYCGAEPAQTYSPDDCNGPYTYNGLDRIDSSLGYTMNNVAPCCKDCNYAKRARSLEDYEEWIRQSYEHLFAGGERRRDR